MTRSVLALGLFLVGCNGTATDEGTTDTTDTTEPACTNPIVPSETFPEPDSTDVYYRTSIRVALFAADPSAVLTVATADGTEVVGASTVEGDVVIFTPDAPLMPSTVYNVTLSYDSCEDAVITWTTSDVGGPLDVDVVGKVYELDLSSGLWLEPPGVGAALAALAADVEVLVSPTEADAQVSFLGALGDGTGDQDICSETFTLDGADFNDPYFELEADELPFSVGGIDVDITDLFLSGAFAPDGSELAGVVLVGTVDTRALVSFVPGEGDDAVCEFAMELAGVGCTECPSGEGPYCLSVRVESIEAPEVVGADALVPRVQADIDVDDRCTVGA